MAIPAEAVFAQAMSAEEMAASDLRFKDLRADYDGLQALRKALGLTQEAVGQIIGKRQVSIAQLEKRPDVLLSTLRDYVEALGGELELVVTFKDRPPVRLTGMGGAEPSRGGSGGSAKGD